MRLEKFLKQDHVRFGESREFQLLTKILKAASQADPDEWNEAITEYSKISLSGLSESWKQEILKSAFETLDVESLT